MAHRSKRIDYAVNPADFQTTLSWKFLAGLFRRRIQLLTQTVQLRFALSVIDRRIDLIGEIAGDLGIRL